MMVFKEEFSVMRAQYLSILDDVMGEILLLM